MTGNLRDRVESFSDAVMAIIMTLLVLDLRPPEVMAHAPLPEYLHIIGPLAPHFISFTLSFTTVTTFWLGHYFFFQHITRVTRGLLNLNILLLFWLCILPFPTQFLGAHPTDAIPIILYGLDGLFLGLTLGAMRWHAARTGLFDSETSAMVKGPRYSIPGVVLNGLAIVLAPVNSYAAAACLLLVAPLYFVPQVWYRLVSAK